MIYESLQSKDCRLFLFLVVDAMVDVSWVGQSPFVNRERFSLMRNALRFPTGWYNSEASRKFFERAQPAPRRPP